MFCPKCSQAQISEDIRYCSRCGFPLSAVSEAIKNDGIAERDTTQSVPEIKKSAMIGFGLVTLSAVFLLATLIIGTPEPSFVVQMNLLVAILAYLAALGYVLYKFLPARKKTHTSNETSRALFDAAPTTRNLLNEQDLSDSIAASRSFDASKPKEMVGTSVTEDTTTLLDKN